MKYCLLCLILWSCANSPHRDKPVAQTPTNTVTPTIDTLEKYSYFIYGHKRKAMSIRQGTGFFMRLNKRSFFVTAAHVLSFWDYKNNKLEADGIVVDNFYVRIKRKNDNDFDSLLIDPSKYKTVKIGYAFQYPDLCFIEFDNLSMYDVNYIEFDKKDYPIKDTISGVIIWGFPVNDVVNDLYTYMRLPPSKSFGEIAYDYSKKIYWPTVNKEDSINYQILITEGEAKEGMSGSPIFLKTGVNNKIIFGGIAAMGDQQNRYIFGVRPDIVIEQLKKKK